MNLQFAQTRPALICTAMQQKHSIICVDREDIFATRRDLKNADDTVKKVQTSA